MLLVFEMRVLSAHKLNGQALYFSRVQKIKIFTPYVWYLKTISIFAPAKNGAGAGKNSLTDKL